MRWGNLIFYVLMLIATGLAGWLSHRHSTAWDWSDQANNTLSRASIELLARLESPLEITSFAPEEPGLRGQIREIVARYQRQRPDIRLVFVDPARNPDLTRELGIQVAGELRLEYQGRSENLRQVNEQGLSNAIQRLVLQGERWIGAIEGHGERKLEGQANHDLGEFGAELARKGFRIQPLELTISPVIPDNTGLLIIAGPQSHYLPGETALVVDYLRSGGNLVWLMDPGSAGHLQPVADMLGVRLLPGTIVDANAATLGLDDPAMAVVPSYPDHPATRGFNHLTLFPHAAALENEASTAGWEVTPLLRTLQGSWNETGPIRGEITRDAGLGEQQGPLTIGFAYTRQHAGRKQRLVVIGDGDFLANAYLGNGGNLDLGLNLVRWLTGDDSLLDIPARTASDRVLELPPISGLLIGFGFLAFVPAGLAVTGVLIWWRRRQ